MKASATGIVLAIVMMATTPPDAATAEDWIGTRALGDWTNDAPGVRRLIRPSDLPPPFATDSYRDPPTIVPPPPSPPLRVPEGFRVRLFASGLDAPRRIRVAPNGDVFVAESLAGQIRVLRTPQGGIVPTVNRIFASGLNRPFGIAFYPPGPDPSYVYIAETDRVIRFRYRNGALTALGPAEPIALDIPGGAGHLPGGGHWTRDVAFGLGGARMFVSVGSSDNVAQSMPDQPASFIARHEARYGRGAAWGVNTNRAAVLVFSPTGGLASGTSIHTYATGLRNCTSMDIHPITNTVWCANTERDGLGDDLVPDFVSRVGLGNTFGWPWFYAGTFQDPRHPGERRELVPSIRTPEVLIQAHSSPLGIAFYDGSMFPPAYRNDAFVTLRGSWNRSKRTGYKVVRILTDEVHRPTGWYEDFLVGFVLDDERVFGRPVGIDVARDGALLVGEDGNGTIWRISYERP